MAAYPAPRFIISDEQAAFARQLAELLPAQGEWSEAEYLWLTNRTNRLVEFSAGYVDILPMPTPGHQRIVAFVYGVMLAFITSRSLGTLLFAPLRVYLQPGKWREPDLVFY